MSFLKVLNVGQGDCMTIRPPHSQFCSSELIYVDLGNGVFDISKEISGEEVCLILTHSHRDHVYGIGQIFPYMDRVKEIVLPFCFNEIWLIAKAIMNLKGMKYAFDLKGAERVLTDCDVLRSFLKAALGNKKIKVTFAYDGYVFRKGMVFLNPALPFFPLGKFSDLQAERLFGQIENLFEQPFASRLISYISEMRRSGTDHAFQGEFISPSPMDQMWGNRRIEEEFARAGCEIVLRFLQNNSERMLSFNEKPDANKLRGILNNFQETAHDACLILKIEGVGKKSYLLSGDASKNAFLRLIGEGRSLHADIFKIPHHGSEKNLNAAILRAVNPSVAIISHGNGKFGRARDAHPNQKVLRLLSNAGVEVFVTNDVFKKGTVVLRKRKYADPFFEIE